MKKPRVRNRRNENKKAYRKVRSRRKRHLYLGGRLTFEEKRKYHLLKCSANCSRNLGVFTKEQMTDHLFNRLRVVPVPEVFCLKTNPHETINFLGALSKLLFEEKCRNIFISHQKTRHLGLEASHLFDLEIKRAQEYWKTQSLKFKFAGAISENKEVNNALLAFGLLRALQIDSDKLGKDKFDADYLNKYEVLFKVGNKSNPNANGDASTALANYFDRCLRYNGWQLTDDARGNIISAISEIIDNAEEHSNSNDPWVIRGGYDKDSQFCSFLIISTGRTIYQSLSSQESTAREVLEKVETIVTNHKGLWEKTKEIFGKESQNEENVWNVMALQE